MISEHELAREAARVLPKLAKDAGYLAPAGEGAGRNAKASCGLYTKRNGCRRPVLELAGALVEEMVRRGWLEWRDGRATLTDAGTAWLRRRRAGGEPYREQHQRRAVTHREQDGVQRPVVVNETESPLGWLRRRKDRDGTPLIDAHQLEAGERLRADFWRAQMAPRITANWESQAPSKRARRAAPRNPAEFREAVVAARQRVVRALEAVGPELAGVLVDVCCHLQGLAEVEKSQSWPQRSGKVILQIALTRLARHYGLLGADDGSAQMRARLRHWGAEDYRPSLDTWR